MVHTMFSHLSTPARLAGFAMALLLTLGGGYAVGAAVGPLDDPAPAPHTMPAHESDGDHP